LLRGNPNTEVSGEVDLLGYVVPAGKMVRWKVLSGPVPQDAAWPAR
jgi:hypothetical protein